MRGISTKGWLNGMRGWRTRCLRSGNISPQAEKISLHGISRQEA
jgi:hypothetical protein